MKKIFLIFITMLAMAIPSQADERPLPQVTVFGTAVTEVIPDQMVWHLQVRNTAKLIENAADDHAQIVQKVIAFLKGVKIKEDLIQTSDMQFGENWEYKSGSRVREGYFAATDITFKLNDFTKYRKLWSGLSKIPSISVQTVVYDHSKRIEYQNETRQKAALAARDKAMTLAKTLGAEVGEPLLIEEDLSMSPYGNMVQVYNRNDTATDGLRPDEVAGLSPGRIPIKMRVKISFHLLSAVVK
jgi:uncharacterized protein YggE